MKFWWQDAESGREDVNPDFSKWLDKIGIYSDFTKPNADMIVIQALWKEIQDLKK